MDSFEKARQLHFLCQQSAAQPIDYCLYETIPGCCTFISISGIDAEGNKETFAVQVDLYEDWLTGLAEGLLALHTLLQKARSNMFTKLMVA